MGIVAVTGATGFVGSHLCEEIDKEGYQLRRALRRHGEQNGVIVGDIGPDTDWADALAGVECVVHLAARVHVMQEQAADSLADFRKVNTDGTLNLARQSVAAGIKRFIYLSSIKVNGEQTQPGCPFSADDNPCPLDAYGVSKHEAEEGLLLLASETGMEVVIIRPPLIYGPGVKANFYTMMRLLYGSLPLPFGAIYNQRSLASLDNLIDLVIICIEHPAAANQVFLVSDGEDLSTTELLQHVANALGKNALLLPINQKLLEYVLSLFGKKGLSQKLCGSLQVDISKAKKLLNWEPSVSVDEGLQKTAQHFLEHQPK